MLAAPAAAPVAAAAGGGGGVAAALLLPLPASPALPVLTPLVPLIAETAVAAVVAAVAALWCASAAVPASTSAHVPPPPLLTTGCRAGLANAYLLPPPLLPTLLSASSRPALWCTSGDSERPCLCGESCGMGGRPLWLLPLPRRDASGAVRLGVAPLSLLRCCCCCLKLLPLAAGLVSWKRLQKGTRQSVPSGQYLARCSSLARCVTANTNTAISRSGKRPMKYLQPTSVSSKYELLQPPTAATFKPQCSTLQTRTWH